MNLTSQNTRLHVLTLTEDEAASLAVFLGAYNRSSASGLDTNTLAVYDLLSTRNDRNEA